MMLATGEGEGTSSEVGSFQTQGKKMEPEPTQESEEESCSDRRGRKGAGSGNQTEEGSRVF